MTCEGAANIDAPRFMQLAINWRTKMAYKAQVQDGYRSN
jgi:hypothetical protein